MRLFKALLIGCQDQTLADVRLALDRLAIEIAGVVPDVDSCRAHLQGFASEKRLLIVSATSPAEIAQLERLNAETGGQPIVALVDSQSGRSTRTQGPGVEVVQLPMQADELRSAVERLAGKFDGPVPSCRTVVVSGAGEGSGCTTIAVNLASEFARLQNAPCLLGEQAVSFGRLANYFGIRPLLTMYDLVSDLDHLDAERMRQAVTQIEENLMVIVGSYRAITPFTVTPEVAFKVLACTMQLAETVVVDARNHFEEIDLEFASKAQHVVLVAKPTIPSLDSLRTLLESFGQREFRGKLHVVINQFVYGPAAISKEAIERHLDVSEVFLVASDASAVRKAENAGQPLRKSVRRSEALDDITALACAILDRPPERPARWSIRDSLSRMAYSLSLK